MKKTEFDLVVVISVLCLSLIVGCGKKETGTTQPQDMNNAAAESNASRPDTAKQTSEPSEDQYVLVGAKCVVYHSGYRGIIVAPGVSKPTEGTVVALECNGKKVEIADKAIVDGYIQTKEFGKIGIRFGSMVATVGAGDFTSVREGSSVPERAIEVYTQESRQKDFMALISK